MAEAARTGTRTGPRERTRVLVLNQVAASGLALLPAERYEVGADVADPAAIVLRSASLHERSITPNVCAIARAGAGTNNIPLKALSARGVPVFNAPGANANAVKEMVLAGMLIAARELAPALQFTHTLDVHAADLEQRIEAGKKQFAGRELARQTLGIVGLGKVGSLVADAAIKLGMHVIGYDPEITVDAAWNLPSQVRRAASVDEVLKSANFVSLHVPLLDSTRGLVGAHNLALMQRDAVLLNFSRDGVADNTAVVQALQAGALAHYVCDFPAPALHGQPRVVALPHLGASTREAEENCALMVVTQLRDFLEHGNITHAVNFPSVTLARESAWRVAIANANVPNMLGQISTAMASAGLNIHNMVNKSRGEMAYTLVDVDSPVRAEVLAALAQIHGVLSLRYLPAA